MTRRRPRKGLAIVPAGRYSASMLRDVALTIITGTKATAISIMGIAITTTWPAGSRVDD